MVIYTWSGIVFTSSWPLLFSTTYTILALTDRTPFPSMWNNGPYFRSGNNHWTVRNFAWSPSFWTLWLFDVQLLPIRQRHGRLYQSRRRPNSCGILRTEGWQQCHHSAEHVLGCLRMSSVFSISLFLSFSLSVSLSLLSLFVGFCVSIVSCIL